MIPYYSLDVAETNDEGRCGSTAAHARFSTGPLADYSYHGHRPDGGTLDINDAELRSPVKYVGLNHLPSVSPNVAGGAGHGPQPGSLEAQVGPPRYGSLFRRTAHSLGAPSNLVALGSSLTPGQYSDDAVRRRASPARQRHFIFCGPIATGWPPPMNHSIGDVVTSLH